MSKFLAIVAVASFALASCSLTGTPEATPETPVAPVEAPADTMAPAAPEVAAPEVAAPEVAAPEVAAPEVAAPAAPEVAAPAAPEVAAPAVEAPAAQ